ncbi:DUF4124 domain-containing protein [Rheinheimera sp. UJ63]|uniref:DUF4124 domain-containing protein n=1 Tax=Rheinheimera sp. UJ63 TaxID=2910157 RepID=UPI001F438733|nr:DUF4124 domain-containing protein [Rheinheimera sp. UJ63]MCF4008987.1 DUF4124 domain-containing protein [Rheinheimera sp. UJ63]
MDRTMAKASLIFMFLVSLTSSTAMAQTVYSWQDARGVTHFGQQPPREGNYQLVTVRTNAASRSSVRDSRGNPVSSELDPMLCQKAQEQSLLLRSGQELFTQDANKNELRLLTEVEREQQTMLVNFEIKRRCAPTP